MDERIKELAEQAQQYAEYTTPQGLEWFDSFKEKFAELIVREMTEKQFKEQYIRTFLASYMARRYDDDCRNGHPNEPYNHQPIEDAAFLANCAWEQYSEYLTWVKE